MESMVTLRCTQKLQRRLGPRAIRDNASSTTALGDWHGNLWFTKHARLVVFVSERSRLAELLHARDFPTLEARFRAAVVELLGQLNVSEEAIRYEEQAMAEIVYASTNNRSVLGTMNDYCRGLRWMFETSPMMTLTQYALELSTTPCGPLEYANPREVTQFLLSDWRNWSFTPQVQ
jgi:hypothetical protein